jgi:mono/diheme cytochrome c family protein
MHFSSPSLITVGIVAFTWVAAAALADVPHAQTRPTRVDHQSGAYLFRAFCASCHGQSGKGDGIVADLLKQPPPDLRQLSSRAGGTFPRDAVIRAIDGRTAPRAHGAEMPIWGDRFQVTEGQSERVIKERIEALASHIQSIQMK